jgi:hypothetical protein
MVMVEEKVELKAVLDYLSPVIEENLEYVGTIEMQIIDEELR